MSADRPGSRRMRSSGELPRGLRPVPLPESFFTRPSSAAAPAPRSLWGGRLRRWSFPASVAAFALVATGTLAASLSSEEPAADAARPGAPVVAPGPAAPEPGPSLAQAPVPPEPGPAVPGPAVHGAPALDPGRPLVQPVTAMAAVAPLPLATDGRGEALGAPATVRGPRPPGQSRPAAPGAGFDASTALATAGSDLAALALAPSLPDRFKVVDAIAARSADLAEPALAALLDAELPGSAYEAATLRLAVLGKLGRLPGARTEALLVAALDPARPRPERLTALEALAPRADAGRISIEALARDDHDAVVQEKARAILARAR